MSNWKCDPDPNRDCPAAEIRDRIDVKLDTIMLAQSELYRDVAVIKTDLGNIQTAMDKIDRSLEGNGRPGLKSEVEDIKDQVTLLKVESRRMKMWLTACMKVVVGITITVGAAVILNKMGLLSI